MPRTKYITHFIGKTKGKLLNEEKYLEHFSQVTNENIIGEANTAYLADPDSPKLIKNKIPNVKIIILLRDPVERTFSEYVSYMGKGKLNCPLDVAILEDPPQGKGFPVEGMCQKNGLLERGLYYEQVKRYLETFGSNQVGIWFAEDMQKNPNETIKQIFNFLGINAKMPDTSHKYNKYQIPRSRIFYYVLRNKTPAKILRVLIPTQKLRTKLIDLSFKEAVKPVMSNDARKKLENYFRSDVNKLENLLQTNLPWVWIKKPSEINL
jgi:hypothetical protein